MLKGKLLFSEMLNPDWIASVHLHRQMAFQGAQMGGTICLYKTALNVISSESFSFKYEDHLLAGSEEEEEH